MAGASRVVVDLTCGCEGGRRCSVSDEVRNGWTDEKGVAEVDATGDAAVIGCGSEGGRGEGGERTMNAAPDWASTKCCAEGDERSASRVRASGVALLARHEVDSARLNMLVKKE